MSSSFLILVITLTFLTGSTNCCMQIGGGNPGDGNNACFTLCFFKKKKHGTDYVGQTDVTDKEYPVKIDEEEDEYKSNKEISSLESSGDDWYKENSGSGYYNTDDNNNNKDINNDKNKYNDNNNNGYYYNSKNNNRFYSALRDIAAKQGLHV